MKLAGTMITIAIMPFIAKFGTTVGPQIDKIVEAGPALVIQELGNLGTIAIAFPVAVFLLRMGREAIGATFSIDREPNIALIADKYGLNSPEGAGAMGVYAVGTLIGTFVFAIMPPLVLALGVFDVRALAMSCGVGSGSMLAACTGGLVAALPEQKDTILARRREQHPDLCDGPLCRPLRRPSLTEWLYRKARPAEFSPPRTEPPAKDRTHAAHQPIATQDAAALLQQEDERRIDVRPFGPSGRRLCPRPLRQLDRHGHLASGGPARHGGALRGLRRRLAMARFMPFYLPSVAWISLVAILVTIPGVPGSAFVTDAVAKLNFLALATPALAYAGLASRRASSPSPAARAGRSSSSRSVSCSAPISARWSSRT